MSGSSTSLAAVVGDTCTTDYVIIQSGGSTLPPTPAATRYDRFCGGVLGGPGATTTITIYSNKLPFNMIVRFDGTEYDPSPPTTAENSLGFYLHWALSACT